MRLIPRVTRSSAVLVVVAACGGSAFSTSGSDGGSGSSSGSSSGGGSGGSSGSGSGSSSGTGSSSSGGTGDASTSDGMPAPGDGAVVGDAVSCTSPPTKCGSMVCDGTAGQQGELCCVDPAATPPVFGCASCSCGCATQLECPVPTGCGTGRVCCITQESCGGGQHWVAGCKGALQCTGKRICDPTGNAAVDCAGVGTTCSTDTSSIGIPANTGYGVCR